MKALKILTVLCFILVFSTNNANSQAYKGTQQFYHGFTPAEVPCLTEIVQAVFTEYQNFSNFTYHAKVRGIAIGAKTNEEYTISYEYNQLMIYHEIGYSERFTFPIVLKHDGKLVAVIHYSHYFVYTGNGVIVLDGGITKVECR